MASVKNIVYVPDTDVVQVLVSFPYKGKTELAVMSYTTATYPELTNDFKAVQLTETFNTLVNAAIDAKKYSIDNPIL